MQAARRFLEFLRSDEGRFRLRLWIFAWLVGLCVQTGTLGEVNTTERLKATRWLWQDVPQADHPGWMVRGREGRMFVTYGIGQSLVMLPADLVAGTLERGISQPRLREKLREGVVAFLTFPPLTATAVLVACLMLMETGFSRGASLAGALALQLGSSFLHYCQDHEENSLMVLLGVVMLRGGLRWMRTGASTDLMWPAAAIGYGFLIRQPFLAVPAGIALALMGTSRTRPASGPSRGQWMKGAAVLGVGTLAGFLFERLYHFHRFGRWTGTYFSVASEQARETNPALPEGWMLAGDFWEGFWGPLISPQRSLLAFDPLLLLLPLGFWAVTGPLRIRVRWVVAGLAAAFLAQVVFYARYIAWEGAAAWANRHTLVPVQLVIPFAAALVIQGWSRLPRWSKACAALVAGFSLAVQVASVIYPDALEGYAPGVVHKPGGIRFERPLWVVGQRFAYIRDGILGREHPDPGGRQFHKVCLAPAVAAREFPRFAWVAWTAWGALAAVTFGAGWRLAFSARPSATTLPPP